jgi:hypothetical protein
VFQALAVLAAGLQILILDKMDQQIVAAVAAAAVIFLHL